MRVSDKRIPRTSPPPPVPTKPTHPTTETPLFVDRRVASALLGVNIQIVDRMIREERLPAYHAGRRVLIKRSDLIAAVEACPVWEVPRGER